MRAVAWWRSCTHQGSLSVRHQHSTLAIMTPLIYAGSTTLRPSPTLRASTPLPPALGVRGGDQTASGSGGNPPVPSAPPVPGPVAQAMDHLDERLRLLLADRRQSNESMVAALAHPPQAAAGERAPPPGSTRPATGPGAVAGASPLSMGAARWGASEGGLDGLGWVRGLVSSSSSSAPPPATLMAAQAAGAGGNRREDVALLNSWLEEMMARVKTGALLAPPGASFSAASAGQVQQQLLASLPPGSGDAGGSTRQQSGERQGSLSPTELAEGALRIYGIAFGELRKQVRGAALWW